MGEPPSEGIKPEMVGASSGPTVLSGRDAEVDVVIDRQSVDAFVADNAAARHVYLGVEDVEAARAPELAYEVFVTVPDMVDAVPQYVGSIGFFGVGHLSRGGEDVHGFRQVFDITAQVASLRDAGAFDDSRLRVTFRPVGPVMAPGVADALTEDEEAAITAAAARPVRVGRVSVFYA